MLENKIASLVETLKYADLAEKKFLMKEDGSTSDKSAHSLSRDDAILKALNSISENLKTGNDDKVCLACNIFYYFLYTQDVLIYFPGFTLINVIHSN